jgi:hypothetical protein
MSDDNVMYDSPLEFVQDAISHSDLCVAQSVIPALDGGYTCGCSCEQWETRASSLEEGLALARVHTGTVLPGDPT